MRTAAICPTCATYTNAVCVLYDGPYLATLDINPLTDLEEVIQKINARFGTISPPIGYTPENVANKSTNTSLGTSNTLYPSQNAVKTYVDAAISAIPIPTLQQVTTSGLQTSNIVKYENGFDVYDPVNTQWLEVRGGDSLVSIGIAGNPPFFFAENGNIAITDSASKVAAISVTNLSGTKQFNLPNIAASAGTLVASVNGVAAGTNGNVTIPVPASYTVYSALVSFDGSVVSAFVLENTLGVTLNWTNPSNGVFRATAASGSPFTSNKTWISSGSYNNAGTVYIVASQPRNLTPTQAIDFSFFLHDGTLTATPTVTNFSIEIRVYP